MILNGELLVGRELHLERIFEAPRALVFAAWTDPVKLAQWWGPRGFTNPVCEIDVRPGGAWRIEMRAPNGQVFPMLGRYVRIDEPVELVFLTFAHLDAQGNPGFEVENTVSFEDLGNRTRLRLKAVVMKARPEDRAALDGMEQGWTQSLQRLEEVARSHSASDKNIAPSEN